MNSQEKSIILAIGIICLCLGLLIGLGVAMIPEGKCIRSPLNYGITQLEKGGLKITCECYFNNPNYAPFFFNETGAFPYGK
jgi:hypothetical protein